MFYILDVEDHVRVEPRHFGLPTHEAIEKQLNEDFKDSISKEFGYVISVLEVGEIDDGVIISGDGAAYYNAKFKLIVWKPELQELVYQTRKIAERKNLLFDEKYSILFKMAWQISEKIK